MDELKAVYEKAFTGIGPSDHVRERVRALGRGRTARPAFVRRLSGVMAAALLLLALLGCGAAVVVYGEGIQGFFARQWERLTGAPMDEGQAALIHHLSQDLELSQTVNGVTVTLDSATVGEDVFYLLLRVEDNSILGDRVSGFDRFDVSLSTPCLESFGGCGWSSQGLDAEGRALLLVEQGYRARPGWEDDGSPLEVTLTLSGPSHGSGTAGGTSAAGGGQAPAGDIWEFQFTLDRTKISSPVSLPDTQAVVTDYFSGERYAVHFTNIQVTSTGLHYDLTVENGDFPDLWPVLVLEDGTEINGKDGSGSRIGEDTFRCAHRWSVPVDLSQAAAVRFGDTDIPLP